MPGHADYEKMREALRRRYMAESLDVNVGERDGPTTLTGGVDHLALICSDIAATIEFYTEVLKMPLTRIVPNRDEPTSTHIFLDMGGGNRLAFFDFPKHGTNTTVRGVGGMHHIALKATLERYQSVIESLRSHDIEHSIHDGKEHSSVYFRDPDDILLEVTTNR